MLAAHKITIHIIQYFIAIYIAMVVRSRYRLRMIIIHAGYKGTDYKRIGFECLVSRRRHVYPAGDWFKIMNRKNIRIAATIPPYHIKRMSTIMQTIEDAFLFGFDEEITFLIICLQILWWTYISFTIRRMFHQLSIFTHIAFGKTQWRKRF